MSADFGLLSKLYLSVVEKYEEKENSRNIDPSTIVTIILSVILGIIAFTLSWSCNTALGYNIIWKAFYGTFAFIFGLTYIILYLLLRWDTCRSLINRKRR
jgi:uncharacterized membrane protein YGL010W